MCGARVLKPAVQRMLAVTMFGCSRGKILRCAQNDSTEGFRRINYSGARRIAVAAWPLTAAAEAGVEDVAEGVAEDVEAVDGDGDRQAGPDRLLRVGAELRRTS